jgi:prepilin-type N-terminal cleavage/methylation domain-containing protein
MQFTPTSGEGGKQMFRQLRSQKGITLVELMVVVAIIAIIAAVAITVFQDIQKKAKLAADQGNVAAMRSAVAIYYGKNNGIFPGGEPAVESLVTPLPQWQCGTPPGYTPGNGKLDFTVNVTDCP